jgi:hypothetical protein
MRSVKKNLKAFSLICLSNNLLKSEILFIIKNIPRTFEQNVPKKVVVGLCGLTSEPLLGSARRIGANTIGSLSLLPLPVG